MPATDAGSISTKSTGEFADSTLAKYTGGPDVDSGVDGELASLASDAKKREQKLAKEVKSRKDAKLAGLQSPALGGDTDGEDAEEERAGTVDQDANISEKIKNKTPEEIFALFDKSSDGKLSFEEFRDMLPQLGFKLSAAKALKYFRTVDSDGSGEIDLDEFKTAMFAIDPESGNPVGFAPNSLLTPMDAFQLFDEDNSGAIDEDEFFFLLKYLGVEVTEEKQEALFNKYDKDKSGMIEYAEFRKIWLHLANVKKELMDRGVKLPKFASTAQLGKMLETILDEEEHLEAKAMAEAAKWARWQAKLKHKRAAYDLARHLANSELQSALDAAGAVYVLGTGAFNEFAGDAPQALAMWGLPCNHWDELKKMWANRVLGRTATTGGAQESEERVDDMSDIASAPSSQLLQENPFKGLVVAKNTVAMWGRRISQVALSDSTAFALSDFGEIYAWGGRSHWYHEIRPDSYWQSHWRGDTTERSRLMLQTTKKMEPIELPLDDGNILDPEDAEIEKLRLVAEYYGVWKPPPSTNRLLYVKQELLSKVTIDRMRFSLEMRGKYPEGLNKNELTALLCECLGLELKTLGNLRHRQLRQMELDIISFTKRKRKAQAKSLRLEMERMWQPLREIEAEDAALERAKAAAETESLYRSAEIAYIAHRKKMDEARRNFSPKGKTPRGNSLELGISGITARAGSTLTPRAADSASSVVAGSAHAFLVHHTGDLYAWGVSLSGRLGLDDQVKDAEAPTIVQSLRGQPIIEASAGFSHSAAVAIGGRLYTWGSGACGKLGIGRCDNDCYVSVPARVPIGGGLGTQIVHSVSCGAAHSAAVGVDGRLWVWGCSDGGRLGLGANLTGNVWEPTLVQSLSSYKLVGVSCGSTHTLCVSAVIQGRDRSPESCKGGIVFQAGSAAALGHLCPDFEPTEGLERLLIRQISAGHSHSAAVSGEGELYCWGSNRGGCCGQPPAKTRFLHSPCRVSALYVRPTNLALGCSARQSSIYAGRHAHAAVDGDKSGKGLQRCMCTQQDPQGWWEVDLGGIASIHEVRLWNRWDVPDDSSLDPELYRHRLFPAWILISADPFGPEVGEDALLANCAKSTARIKLTEPRRCSTWRCPEKTYGRFVRVQMEGFDFLHFAQVEVFGTYGTLRSIGRVGSVCAGRYATAVTMRPSRDPDDISHAYKRAVQADPAAADVLRQLDAYVPEYDKYGRGDAIHGCLLCHAGRLCDLCSLKHEFMTELKSMPLGPGGRLRRLNSIRDFLYGSIHDETDEAPAVAAASAKVKETEGSHEEADTDTDDEGSSIISNHSGSSANLDGEQADEQPMAPPADGKSSKWGFRLPGFRNRKQ